MRNKLLVEAVGTFFLCLAVLVSGGPLPVAALLCALLYMGAPISLPHYNPAVTLAVMLRGKCPVSDVGPYMASQVAGASAAALIVKFLYPVAQTAKDLSAVVPQALLAEFLFTFALCYVVLNVATCKATANNSFYGLAIGMTVMAGAFSVGGISGGAFNPAVAVGISIMNLSAWSNIWIFLVANFVGAAAAATTFKIINPTDK